MSISTRKARRSNILKRAKKATTKGLDSRYPPYWGQLSDFTIAVTLGQCSRCWWRRAKLAHHAWYPWYWLQIPFLCLFPVCRHCHGVVHRQINWIEHANKHFSHNTLETVVSLQLRMILFWAMIFGVLMYLIS
jgi:hypothetical protein